MRKKVFIWVYLFDTLRLPCRIFAEFRPMQVLFFQPFVQPTPAALRSFTKTCMKIARARFEIKTDPILNNYLAQTMEDNARSGLGRVQAEMSLIFVFPTVVRMEKTCVVFEVLDQRTDLM